MICFAFVRMRVAADLVSAGGAGFFFMTMLTLSVEALAV
jgi:hypothetical protein